MVIPYYIGIPVIVFCAIGVPALVTWSVNREAAADRRRLEDLRRRWVL